MDKLNIQVGIDLKDISPTDRYVVEQCAEIVGSAEWKYPKESPVGINTQDITYLGLMGLKIAAWELEGLVQRGDVEMLFGANLAKFSQLSKFKHLCNHSDYTGIYLPIDFNDPIFEPTSCGSSVKLKQELEELKQQLINMPEFILNVLDKFYQIACESVQLGVPIFFQSK